MANNKVLYGLEKVHIAFMTNEETPTWDTPKSIPGAVSFSTEPQGDENTFYADNGPYFTITANNGYTGDLEMALIPNDILAEMLGWEVDSNGMLVEVADATPKPFALMGQIQGDQKNRRFVFYNCTASRGSEEYATKEGTIDPTTTTLSTTIVPIEINGKKIVKGVIEPNDSNSETYENFFNEVLLPSFTE